MRNLSLWPLVFLSVAGCVDAAVEESTEEVVSSPLLGETCAPIACTVGQCGAVPDGCRSEMWCGDCGPSTTALAREREITRIFEMDLSAGSFLVETSNLTVGADPVIHVLDNTGREVAFDDDSAGAGNARIRGKLATAGKLIVRAKSDATRGSGLLSINGALQLIPIGGTIQPLTGLRSGEQVETVKLFGSRTDLHVIYGLAADNLHLATRVAGNGTSGGALFTSNVIGNQTLVLGTLGTTNQPARILRNDVALLGHDVDADGLGGDLEAALGTCATSTSFATGPDGNQFDCQQAIDPRDTDGDGLSDAVEARGVRGTGVHQPLPLWGANPRHKDLFVEIDSSQLTTGGAIPAKPTASELRRFSDYYGDRTRALTPFVALFHAAALKNPDLKPGVSAHADAGVAPQAPGDERIYGDWGGFSVVPPTAQNTGQSPLVAFQSFMTTARRTVFRYALRYVGGGGQSETSVQCLGCGAYGWASGTSIDAFTHESIHAQGLGHSGPAMPNGGVDANCKASYFSIINYAFMGTGYGLSDGLGFPGANNTAVREANVLAPSDQTTMTTLHDLFGYRVDRTNGSVDWNRDGVFAPSGSTVRAYTNFQPGNACEFTRYNPTILPTTMNTRLAPAFGRYGNSAFLFSAGTSPLRFVTAAAPFSCPTPSSQSCVTWSNPQTLALDGTRGVDATAVGQGMLVVTVAADGRPWYMQRYPLASGFPRWTSAQLVPGADVASGQPSLVTLADGSALLMYRRASGELVEAQFEVPIDGGPGAWTRVGLALTTTGTTIFQAAQADPGMVQTELGGSTVFGLFAEGSDAVLKLWEYDVATHAWRRSPIGFDDAMIWWRSVSGRPSAAWVPSADNAQGGRLYIVASSRDGYENDPVKVGTGRGIVMRWSYIHPDTGELRIGQVSPYRTWWDYTYGVDVTYDPAFGPNLRAAWVVSPETNAGQAEQITFEPLADGIVDFPQTNFNDWPYVGFGLCRALVNPLGNLTNPINCGVRPPVP